MGDRSLKQKHDRLLNSLDKSLNTASIDVEVNKALSEQEKMLSALSCEKSFDELVLSEGGATHFKCNGKWIAISVMSTDDLNAIENKDGFYGYQDLPKKHKFHIRNAFGDYVFIKSLSYKDAQDVVDALFGKGRYKVSASNV